MSLLGAREADLALSVGRRVAAWLAGSWRNAPPEFSLGNEDADRLAPFFLNSGTAGLAWWRAKESEAALSGKLGTLNDAYLYQRGRLRVTEKHLVEAVDLLRARGIEPILGKGWAVAAAYSSPGLRPPGDLDLYVDPDAFPLAETIVHGIGAPVDLHLGCPELGDASWPDILGRSVIRPCGETKVRCFGASDHLRLVIRHLLKHGAWRPLWLCDVAALLEAEPLDWSLLPGDGESEDSWTIATVQLARGLLGVRVPESAPSGARSDAPPRWLEDSILEVWGTKIVPHGHREPMKNLLSRPLEFLQGLKERWPNSIEAAVEVGSRADRKPARSTRLRASVRRASRFVKRARSR